jgi:hypothetical protein
VLRDHDVAQRTAIRPQKIIGRAEAGPAAIVFEA